MIDATISRVRMRDLARRVRFRQPQGRFATLRQVCASRPQAASSRPGGGDLVASIIELPYAPGGWYETTSAFRRASSVSSTVSSTVVSKALNAPPPLIASATAAIDTLSGASQRE